MAMRRSCSMSFSRRGSTTRTRSCNAIHRKRNRLDRRRGERTTADERAAFDEQRELTRGELHRLTVTAPQRCEASPLESLLEDAQSRAVPHEHLAPVAAPVDEQEQVTAHRVATQPGLHQSEEAVVAFAQIRRRGIRPDANRATRAEHHRSARNAATASAMSSPSSRKPDGDTIAIADRPSATTSTGTTLVGAAASADPRSASVNHCRTVSYPSPSSSPIVANRAPAARRRVAYATSLAFSSTGYRLPRPFSCLATSRRSASTSSRFIVSLLCRPTIAARDHAPVRTGQGEHLPWIFAASMHVGRKLPADFATYMRVKRRSL